MNIFFDSIVKRGLKVSWSLKIFQKVFKYRPNFCRNRIIENYSKMKFPRAMPWAGCLKLKMTVCTQFHKFHKFSDHNLQPFWKSRTIFLIALIFRKYFLCQKSKPPRLNSESYKPHLILPEYSSSQLRVNFLKPQRQ